MDNKILLLRAQDARANLEKVKSTCKYAFQLNAAKLKYHEAIKCRDSVN